MKKGGLFYEETCYFCIASAIAILLQKFVIAVAIPKKYKFQEGKMSYKKAEHILPLEIIELFRTMQMENVYISQEKRISGKNGEIQQIYDKSWKIEMIRFMLIIKMD